MRHERAMRFSELIPKRTTQRSLIKTCHLWNMAWRLATFAQYVIGYCESLFWCRSTLPIYWNWRNGIELLNAFFVSIVTGWIVTESDEAFILGRTQLRQTHNFEFSVWPKSPLRMVLLPSPLSPYSKEKIKFLRIKWIRIHRFVRNPCVVDNVIAFITPAWFLASRFQRPAFVSIVKRSFANM